MLKLNKSNYFKDIVKCIKIIKPGIYFLFLHVSIR